MSGRFIDRTGQRFGRLIAVRRAVATTKGARWDCICDCGTEKLSVLASNLARGAVASCGCLLREWGREHANRDLHKPRHGHAPLHRPKSRTYTTWQGMLRRCYNKNDRCFNSYGARGIAVCDRWRNSFDNFLADMGEKPLGVSIDRVNNDGNYEPGNCRWATNAQQALNRSDNVRYTLNGETLTVKEWAQKLRCNRNTIRLRLNRGWSIEKAIGTSPRQFKSKTN